MSHQARLLQPAACRPCDVTTELQDPKDLQCVPSNGCLRTVASVTPFQIAILVGLMLRSSSFEPCMAPSAIAASNKKFSMLFEIGISHSRVSVAGWCFFKSKNES
jgi:hypothetical protein